MKASNLTVCVPKKPDGVNCDKECPYCISKMTPNAGVNNRRFYNALPKVITLAKHAQVTNVLLTGKGEPFLNFETSCYLAEKFKEFPVEIQTNGLWLNTKFNYYAAYDVYKLTDLFDVIAFSLDSLQQFEDYEKMFRYLRQEGIVIRVTLNVSSKLEDTSLNHILGLCRDTGVHQLMLRKITIPQVPVDTPESRAAIEWIARNAPPSIYEKLDKDLQTAIEHRGRQIRVLPFTEDGVRPILYDVDGISVTSVAHCIQESRNGGGVEEIRSIILQTDGHVYTSWGSLASILF